MCQAGRRSATASSLRADLARVLAEVVEPRQLRERLEPEHALEQLGRPIAHGTSEPGLATGFHDEPALDEPGDDRVRGHATHAGDVGTRARAEVRDDRQGLECRLGEPALDGTLHEARARCRFRPRRAKGVAAGHVLEDDAAPPFGVALSHEVERALDASLVLFRRRGEVFRRQRRGSDDEERLQRAGEAFERLGVDES